MNDFGKRIVVKGKIAYAKGYTKLATFLYKTCLKVSDKADVAYHDARDAYEDYQKTAYWA